VHNDDRKPRVISPARQKTDMVASVAIAAARAPKGVNKAPRRIPDHLLPEAVIAAQARARRKDKAESELLHETPRGFSDQAADAS
jgi:hypothetical protein